MSEDTLLRWCSVSKWGGGSFKIISVLQLIRPTFTVAVLICSTLTEVAVRHQTARQVCSDQLAPQWLSSCLPLPLLIDYLLDGRGQHLPKGGGDKPHRISRSVPGGLDQKFLLSPSLLVPVSVSVEWNNSSICPGTLQLISRYSTGIFILHLYYITRRNKEHNKRWYYIYDKDSLIIWHSSYLSCRGWMSDDLVNYREMSELITFFLGIWHP